MLSPPNLSRRVRLRLRGIVQGIGFRPFVHNLAAELGLGGWVLNSSSGLVTEVEGEPSAVESFLSTVTENPPPLAWIQDSKLEEIEPSGETAFVIRPSAPVTGEFALISPDVAACDDCVRDFTDPANRRAGYAFTNCTNCGPRYTIIQDIPYDRPKTTMAPFTLCAACQAEYENPADRRFHAQPNACPKCGPSLSAGIEEARKRLAAGEIVGIKGLGGFQLACDARNAGAVQRLRERKKRSDKPFALMARDLAAAESVCEIGEADRAALTSPRGPIVILPCSAERTAEAGRQAGRSGPTSGALPEAIAPGNRTLGVMLPYTPLHHLLFAGAPYDLLVMTSGNLSEEPIVISNEEALSRLTGVADWFLTHNRDIYMRTDDSVVRTFDGVERTLRRSRGYAPRTLDLKRMVPELLACGGELKNAFCLTKGTHAILSQHIGDMENYETLAFFEETLANLKKLFRVEPRAVAHDLHPLYLSTWYAQAIQNLPKFGVQHHHAHIASCMAENGLDGTVIGVAFDGSGYGIDGTIWGGEFFISSYASFERLAHFRNIPLAGGDAAIREPWRVGLAYLMDTIGSAARLEGVPEESQRVVRRMIERGVNTVPASSCGRLFDAVAAIIGLRREITFEGQAAIELETIAANGEDESYPVQLEGGVPWQLDFRPAIERIVRDLAGGVLPGVISARFHNTVAKASVEVCRGLRGETGLNRVCLSGGTFQNIRLLSLATAGLRAQGFDVYLHAQVPPNDGGIALGQAAIAARIMG